MRAGEFLTELTGLLDGINGIFWGGNKEGRFRSEAWAFPEGEGRAESGNGDGWKLEVRLMHGCDLNAFREKAVSLEVLDGLRCLKSFVLL